jgi:GrpB-like predicted nucleotidyltransferase (UPF0157 family)
MSHPPSPEGSRTPLRDEEIRAATIGELAPLTGRISIMDYDADWPRRYRREEARLRATLGSRALRIEHVGSTSVPGLAAKPIIDMLLVVADSSDETAYAADMEAAGYVLRIREADWYEHRVFKGPDTNINLHVFSTGCPEVDRMLAFRDSLRVDDADRTAYEATKRSLAERDWKYVQNYADAKTEIVESIMPRALAWASEAGAAKRG